jgi:hypothetical protein
MRLARSQSNWRSRAQTARSTVAPSVGQTPLARHEGEARLLAGLNPVTKSDCQIP